MSRNRRLHLPGVAFHITARTQNGSGYFIEELRAPIADDIVKAMRSFGHTLLAYVVMPNHFHIVIRQGDSPLGWVMQRIMQRTAARVRRSHGGEGHVFGRPYWAGVCGNPAYIRRAIVYTHMNPCKAGLCDVVDEYPWSSHHNYIASALSPSQPLMLDGLMLFADKTLETAAAVRSYERFIVYCVVQRKNRIPGDWLLPDGPQRDRIPSAALGDTYWQKHYSTFTEAGSFSRANVDVSHAAAMLLSRIDSTIHLDEIRNAGRSRAMGSLRRKLIEGLLLYGCRSIAISRCLNVSPSLVSTVSSHMRFQAAREICSPGAA